MTAALRAYQDQLADARRRLKDRSELRGLVGSDVDSELLHAFLIQWAALSVQLQERTEHFLVEASRRCAEVGEHDLALTLLQIAAEAIDRYRLVADDTRTLAQLWNARRQPSLDLTYLLTQPATVSMKRLHAHAHALVSGPQPWTQLAALYEADAMLGSVAERVTSQARQLLGDEVGACLRSLEALAGLNQRSSLGRTMASFLERNPERVTRMAETGVRTLEIYGDFLVECCETAGRLSLWPPPRQASG
jgi:hypothetical protein